LVEHLNNGDGLHSSAATKLDEDGRSRQMFFQEKSRFPIFYG
jgi:hypothetical protein